jgi:hypothetical protein
MGWNSTWPDGTKSVRANATPGQDNTNYIEATLNNDHWWNVGPNRDGRHKKVSMKDSVTDPALTAGMNGVLYLRTVSATDTSIQLFYNNDDTTFYQVTPTYITGTVSLTSTSTFASLVAVPANIFGTLYIWEQGTNNIDSAVIKSNATKVEGFTNRHVDEGTSNAYFVEVLNGSGAVDLTLKARRGFGPSGTYAYRLLYYGI